jgi:hypothetical protein
VEVSIAIAMKNHMSGLEVLDRKTKSVKFNGTTIITSELSNRKKISNDRQNNKDIV